MGDQAPFEDSLRRALFRRAARAHIPGEEATRRVLAARAAVVPPRSHLRLFASVAVVGVFAVAALTGAFVVSRGGPTTPAASTGAGPEEVGPCPLTPLRQGGYVGGPVEWRAGGGTWFAEDQQKLVLLTDRITDEPLRIEAVRLPDERSATAVAESHADLLGPGSDGAWTGNLTLPSAGCWVLIGTWHHGSSIIVVAVAPARAGSVSQGNALLPPISRCPVTGTDDPNVRTADDQTAWHFPEDWAAGKGTITVDGVTPGVDSVAVATSLDLQALPAIVGPLDPAPSGASFRLSLERGCWAIGAVSATRASVIVVAIP